MITAACLKGEVKCGEFGAMFSASIGVLWPLYSVNFSRNVSGVTSKVLGHSYYNINLMAFNGQYFPSVAHLALLYLS